MPRRQLQGTVVSDKMDKTAVVRVERLKAHPLYRKVIRRHERYKAHDENNEARVGDVVLIEECRPISREKTWRIVEWLRRGGDA
jgi:small subunit ribosomal protein S17